MADARTMSKTVAIKRYERDRLVSQSEILNSEIKMIELEQEVGNLKKSFDENVKQINNIKEVLTDDTLAKKRRERDRLSVMVHNHSLEIKMMELEEAKKRYVVDIGLHQKKIDQIEVDIKRLMAES